MTFDAVPVQTLRNARGYPVHMDPGPCIWCGQWVESKREEAGSTNPFDPCWATEDGDFGCDQSPEANAEGCGDHDLPYDLALHILKLGGK